MDIWSIVGFISAVCLILILVFVCESLIYNKVEEIKQRQIQKEVQDAILKALENVDVEVDIDKEDNDGI